MSGTRSSWPLGRASGLWEAGLVTGMDTFLPAYPSADAALAARQGNRTTA
ncbi:hypothetical protein AB0D42_40415 [Streptomyces sp. NPDC048304]